MVYENIENIRAGLVNSYIGQSEHPSEHRVLSCEFGKFIPPTNDRLYT